MLPYRLIPVACLLLLPVLGIAQLPNANWAGPDTVSCGEKGVMLGVPTDCPNCCFSWSPTEGLDSANVQRPTARPKKPTTYTVVVTDQNFSTMKSDEVQVGLSFGELHFVPDHLTQGTTEIVLARLKNNTANAPTTWSIEGPDLGCTITPNPGDPDLATLLPGFDYGKLLVKVQKTTDSACYFLDTLPVNSGVKDLILIDDNTPNRVARTGDTLYLIGNSPAETKARLIAVPNEGGFAEGIPNYKDMPGSPTPIDGIREQIMDGNPGIFDYDEDVFAAGDEGPLFEPSIVVKRRVPVESSTSLLELVESLNNWFNSFFEYNLDLGNQDFGLGTPKGTPANEEPACTPNQTFDFDFDAGVDVVWKESDVEKYASPARGKKQDCVIDLQLSANGRLYHPYFTRYINLGVVELCSEMYVGFDINLPVHLGVSKDESQPSAAWILNNPQLEVSVSATAGFGASLISGELGYDLNAGGSATVAAKIFLEYMTNSRQLVVYGKIPPVTLKFEAELVSESNMADSESVWNLLSKELVIFKELSTPVIPLYTFPE